MWSKLWWKTASQTVLGKNVWGVAEKKCWQKRLSAVLNRNISTKLSHLMPVCMPKCINGWESLLLSYLHWSRQALSRSLGRPRPLLSQGPPLDPYNAGNGPRIASEPAFGNMLIGSGDVVMRVWKKCVNTAISRWSYWQQSCSSIIMA